MKRIPLTRGLVALVDDEDYEAVSRLRWQANAKNVGAKHKRTYYRATAWKPGGGHISMGRYLLTPPHGMQVDHINGDALDNRRANLRLATPAQNSQNKRRHVTTAARYKGVSKNWNRWKAQIKTKGRLTYLGTFDTQEEAARAYDAKARELFGEFARTNYAD